MEQPVSDIQSMSRAWFDCAVCSPRSLAIWVGTLRRALPALALCVAAVLALSAGVARAEAPRLVPDGQLESQGAMGVTVDQSASESDPSRGDVYVAGFFRFHSEPEEFFPGRVNKFDASGSLLTPPSPFGEAVAYSGTAVNPVNGDVYALDAIGSQVDTYNPVTGELLPGSFPVAASENFHFLAFETVVGIAADSEGNVYVPVVPKNEVLEYSPTGEELKKFKGGSGAGALKGPTSVAIDPAGNVWVADTGNNRIEELSPADTPLGEIASEGVQSVAVDAHGDVFATVNNSADFCGSLKPPCSHLVEYSSAGVQLADLGAGSIGTARGEPATEALANMVAVSDSTGSVYVTETQLEHQSRVFKFRPPVAPKLDSELAVEVGTSEAKLSAVVNPGGLSAAYRFEYGITAAYGHTVPFPEGDTGAGFTSRTVWASASGLLPGTTYHYRVVVTSEVGEPIVGNDQTFTTKTAARAVCSNEQFRTGFSANLPDCRAYELVTPPNKSGAQPDPPEFDADPEAAFKGNLAAVDGNRMSFQAEDVFPGSKSGAKSYVATRGPSGWSSENMFPPQNYYGYECPDELEVTTYSEDLSKAIVPVGGTCGGPEPELVSGEPRGVENLFVRDNTNDSYQLIDVTPPGVTAASPTFVGASDDFSHIVFTEQAKLTANAPDGVANAYEWSGGIVRLLTVIPNGTPVAGSIAGISHDGSRIFFTAGGNLYARVSGTSTVQLDASQAGGPGGGGSFISASADASRVLFSADASAGLTGETTPGSGTNLYKYDFASGRLSHVDASQAGGSGGGSSFVGASADGSQVLFSADASAGMTGDTVSGSGKNLYRYDSKSGRLSDLTPGAHAELQGVFAAGEDLSYVYFEADGSLAPGATQGQPNRYLSHAGTTTFIAALAKVSLGGEQEHLEVSENGAFLAFASLQRLTGYDNTDANTGKPDDEIYLYSAASNTVVCASCNPNGVPPTGGPRWGTKHAGLSPRNLSEQGRVLFDTSEALLPADTNGQKDVYEFEPGGVGSCSDPGGCLSLISTGTGTQETWFIEASPSGNDVFLLEHQKLVPHDTVEEAQTIYDVRVNGGIPEPAVPPACTTADACRAAPAPQPLFPSVGVGTAAVFGEDNLSASPPAVGKPKTAAELRAEKLARALKVCRKDKSKKKRAACDKQARKKYGPAKKAKNSTAKNVSTDRRAK